ncbi:MAG: gas vesicle protein GvpO [Pseudomonadota bacterium]
MTVLHAIEKARIAMHEITPAPIDCIKSCTRAANETWSATVEVVESPARMGDNDLLSAYEIVLDAQGELTEFQRVGRYHREAGAGI